MGVVQCAVLSLPNYTDQVQQSLLERRRAQRVFW